MLEKLRASFEGLNEREKRLVGLLGVVFVLLLVFTPLYIVASSASEIAAENDELRAVLQDIAAARDRLAVVEAERRAAAARYDRRAPPLGTFLEGRARDANYTNPLEVTEQPDKASAGFTRRSVRANLPGVGLATVVDLIHRTKSTEFPVAIDRLQVDHFQTGDRFNVQLGIVTFERTEQARAGGGAAATKAARGAGGGATRMVGPAAP